MNVIRILIYSACFIVAWVATIWCFGTFKKANQGPSLAEKTPIEQSPTKSLSTSAALSQILIRGSSAFDQKLTIEEAAKAVWQERRSPLRAKILMQQRISEMSFEELRSVAASEQHLTHHDYRAIAWEMTRLNPSGTFEMYVMNSEGRFRGIPMHYSFSAGMIKAWLKYHDPVDFMRSLHKLERGGNQQSFALNFSGYWVRHNPYETFKHFEEMVELRNIQPSGTIESARNDYADKIIEAWWEKDLEELKQFVDNLPTGKTQITFDERLQVYTDKLVEKDN